MNDADYSPIHEHARSRLVDAVGCTFVASIALACMALALGGIWLGLEHWREIITAGVVAFGVPVCVLCVCAGGVVLFSAVDYRAHHTHTLTHHAQHTPHTQVMSRVDTLAVEAPDFTPRPAPIARRQAVQPIDPDLDCDIDTFMERVTGARRPLLLTGPVQPKPRGGIYLELDEFMSYVKLEGTASLRKLEGKPLMTGRRITRALWETLTNLAVQEGLLVAPRSRGGTYTLPERE